MFWFIVSFDWNYIHISLFSADIKLENEDAGEGNVLSDICLPPNVYHPRHALMKALKDWLPEFSRQKTVWGPMSKPQVGLSQPTALVLGVNNQISKKTILFLFFWWKEMSIFFCLYWIMKFGHIDSFLALLLVLIEIENYFL